MTERIAAADMPRLLRAPFPDVPLGLYGHHKGEFYLVIGGSLMATGDDQEVMIVYTPWAPADGHFYVAHRTYKDWRVLTSGAARFKLVTPLGVEAIRDHLNIAFDQIEAQEPGRSPAGVDHAHGPHDAAGDAPG